jgi:hypothetical protein
VVSISWFVFAYLLAIPNQYPRSPSPYSVSDDPSLPPPSSHSKNFIPRNSLGKNYTHHQPTSTTPQTYLPRHPFLSFPIPQLLHQLCRCVPQMSIVNPPFQNAGTMGQVRLPRCWCFGLRRTWLLRTRCMWRGIFGLGQVGLRNEIALYAIQACRIVGLR